MTERFEGYEGYAQESLDARRFYNVGAADFGHPYWTNIDFASDHYAKRHEGHAFVQYDLTALAPLPIETGTAEVIYSAHTLEHVPDDAVRNVLAEAYRALKPGGYLRVVVPDADLMLRAYLRGDRHFFSYIAGYGKNPEVSIHQAFLHQFTSQLCAIDPDKSASCKLGDASIALMFSASEPMDVVRQLTALCRYNPEFPASHVNWFDAEKLIGMVREAGFTDVYRSGVEQSACRALREPVVFDGHHEISLYVEAVR